MRPDVATLRELLRYAPETGKLFWLPRTVAHFMDGGHSAEHNAAKWNGKFAGKEAMIANSRGYRVGGILGRQFGAHQVAWALHYGVWPEYDVDHQDHDRSNNRIHNLRIAAPGVNAKNQSRRKTNRTGVTGVHWNTRFNRWVAKIHADGHTMHLGNFAIFEDAVRARRQAERQHGFHPNHGRPACA